MRELGHTRLMIAMQQRRRVRCSTSCLRTGPSFRCCRRCSCPPRTCAGCTGTTACVALRHQGCIGLLESTASSPPQLPAPSVLPTGRLGRKGTALATGANPLVASLSTHPPLKNQATRINRHSTA